MTKKSLSVRARLILLVLATALPVATVLAAVGLWAYAEERQRFKDSLAESARALALLVEREIGAREVLLRTLAQSPTLDQPDLAAFHEFATAAVKYPEAVITVWDRSGQQLVNTRRPYGTTGLPRTIFGERRSAQPEGTLVSGLYMAPIGQQWSFAVDVPVMREGKVVYYLSMGGFADRLQAIFDQQVLRPTWIGSIVDSDGTVVARSIGADRVVGRKVTPDMLEKLSASPRGAFETTAVDGRRVYSTYSRAANYGWTFVIGVPVEEINVSWTARLAFAAVGLMLVGLCLLGALYAGRGISGPVLQLARSSRQLREGSPVAVAPTGLIEADEVQSALAQASMGLRDAARQQESRVQAALGEAARAQQAIIQNQRLEAVGHLTGGVAHDFNNLLMVVSNSVHLLKLQHPDLRSAAALAGIERAVATGTKLTRQLLTFAARQHVQPEPVHLQRQLRELMELLRPTLRGNVLTRCEVAPDTQPVFVDVSELELALINLAVNARDAMPEGGELSLRAHNAPDGSPFVHIEVADTGVGITEAQLQKVFEPFYTTKPVGHGTGLGLSQVYGFATQAGGSATIDSRMGEGTTVRLVLPFAREDGPAHRPAADDALGGQAQGLRILLVEDNADLAAITREVLQAAGCAVESAASADGARQRLEAGGADYDLVLSDIRMPGELSGLGLARWMQAARLDLPILLMTGYSDELQQASESGFEVLQKPCPPDRLLAAIVAASRRPPESLSPSRQRA
ncbi:ATP-binding protein [Ramlibacter rhizophilus]|uniref:histidine kinase n=1 Tax=Ramlibacter rhizophilus TaxID=1781167 RepID=A0A4Z0BTF4_9BURK|nr:ATP-binding protein [Ramlibacter rhizophilus]TFZ01289.1 response regulator [Ramlibacter rhizophilus]